MGGILATSPSGRSRRGEQRAMLGEKFASGEGKVTTSTGMWERDYIKRNNSRLQAREREPPLDGLSF